jgi:ABC-type multidrug transport system ATPase subunit
LFLDEPTTGLSALDARNVMRILRQLADAGRTVVAVIHQPGLEVYNMLDLVLILFMGRLLYYGPPPFSMDYFKRGATHPDDIFYVLDEYEEQIKAEPKRTEELLKGWEKKFRESPEYEKYVEGRIKDLQKPVET